jgi:hypothetical protein
MTLRYLRLCIALSVALSFTVSLFAQQMTVSKAKYFRKSQPLRDMEIILPGKTDRSWKDSIVRNLSFDEVKDIPFQLTPAAQDPVRQDFNGNLLSGGPMVNIDGVGNVDGVFPPDTDGDVGPNHYFQMINLSFAIYDKQGNKLYGPVKNSTLWAGFAGPWAGTNDGDPIVLYDEVADRWFASQFAVNTSNGTYWELIAISQTPDPLGAWYQYAFEFPAFNDYPKVGVWGDAYYASFNMFGSYLRVAAAAFERTEMLAGNPAARMVLYDLPQNAGPWSMLPADVDGQSPPAGAPNYFAYFTDNGTGGGQDEMHFWEFHVDWANVNNSSFTNAFTLAVEPFDAYFCNAPRHACIPQPGTGQKLETLSDRLMYRLQYRNFGTYQTMVTSHAVDFDGNGHGGIRWYEFRKTGSNPWGIHQQGTYAPDASNRWMPSAAMNGNGEIAVGYTLSDETHYPSLRYAGRSANAPLGTLNFAEVEARTGTASQGSYARWGDYASMSIDPVDDTTFWFTTEYMKYGWATRIISFNFGTPSTPTASAGTDTLMCDALAYHNTLASASNQRLSEWTTSGDGYFIKPFEINSIYFSGANDKAAGQVNLTIKSYGYDMVTETTDTMLLSLSPMPACGAGPDTLICLYDEALLKGFAANYDSIKWTSSGDGSFANDTLLETVYTPGPTDISKGFAKLKLTAYPLLPCPVPVYDQVKVNIDACTDVADLNRKRFSISVVPNPSTGVFQYAIEGLYDSHGRMEIYDAMGQLVFNQQLMPSASRITNKLNMQLMPKGVYILKVYKDDEVLTSKLVTK